MWVPYSFDDLACDDFFSLSPAVTDMNGAINLPGRHWMASISNRNQGAISTECHVA